MAKKSKTTYQAICDHCYRGILKTSTKKRDVEIEATSHINAYHHNVSILTVEPKPVDVRARIRQKYPEAYFVAGLGWCGPQWEDAAIWERAFMPPAPAPSLDAQLTHHTELVAALLREPNAATRATINQELEALEAAIDARVEGVR